METTEKVMVYYYEAHIDHNHPKLPMIWKKLKKNVELYALESIHSTNPRFHIPQTIIG